MITRDLCLGTMIADQAASGADISHTRIGVRSTSYDDNGEPLCALLQDHEVHGDKWPSCITHKPTHHHIDTEYIPPLYAQDEVTAALKWVEDYRGHPYLAILAAEVRRLQSLQAK